MRYPYEVNLVGDARTTLQALIPLLQRKDDRGWQEEIQENVARWWEVMEAEALVAAKPVNPMRIFSEFSKQAPENCLIAADSGSAANWYARQVRMRGTMRGTLSGTLATMGPAVPYAIGAKFAHPDRPAVAFEGDGAMQMNGLAELLTIARYYREWTDPRLVVAVLHNNDLNQVTWELRAMGGTPASSSRRRCPTRRTPTSRPRSGWARSRSPIPSTWRTPGARRCPPTGPTSSTCTATPTSRPSRRTRRSSR